MLEADVALPVAKKLIENIKPKAIGQEIIRSTTPGQMIVKVVFDEVVKILGDTKSEIKFKCSSSSMFNAGRACKDLEKQLQCSESLQNI